MCGGSGGKNLNAAKHIRHETLVQPLSQIDPLRCNLRKRVELMVLGFLRGEYGQV